MRRGVIACVATLAAIIGGSTRLATAQSGARVRMLPLPYEVTLCRSEQTGAFGLPGSDMLARVTLANDGQQQGVFTILVWGLYPGGGRIQHAAQDVSINAFASATAEIHFSPQGGLQSIECAVEPPRVAVRGVRPTRAACERDCVDTCAFGAYGGLANNCNRFRGNGPEAEQLADACLVFRGHAGEACRTFCSGAEHAPGSPVMCNGTTPTKP